MNRNNFWRFILVVLVILWSLYELYPPEGRDLLLFFREKAVNRDPTFTAFFQKAQALQKAMPEKPYDNLVEAIGTNAHELPMVAAALADDDDELRWAPYRILDQWRHTYGGNLLIALPDAFGTKSFLRDAPEWVADWTGFRPDSAPPIAAGEEIIKWWKQNGRDPKEKLLVFSDAMDVGSIEETYRHFEGRVRISFGWGTNLTNDFVGCAPDGSANLDPISIVCKVTSVDGRPAVKLSDNPEKATGTASEIERYLRVFGNAGRVRSAVHV